MEDPEWPPRSPRHALLSSPSGKRKYQQLLNSPLKKLATTGALHRAQASEDEEEEDDEETLQLRLKEIQARLRLKKLQTQKARIAADPGSDAENESAAGSSQLGSRTQLALSKRREDGDAICRTLLRPESTNDVHVPVSPAKRRQIQASEPRSPGRILLGIDKGRAAKDVSLRRAPSVGKSANDTLRNSSTAATPGRSAVVSSLREAGRTAGKSFNERMAERRQQEQQDLQKKARVEALRQQRSQGFGVGRQELDSYKHKSSKQHQGALSQSSQQEKGFSREQIMAVADNPRRAASQQHQRVEQPELRPSSGAGILAAGDTLKRPNSSKSISQKRRTELPLPSNAQDQPSQSSSDTAFFEPISTIGLSRRILPHSFLTRTLKDKTVVPLTTMLRHVKKPDWILPDSVVSEDADFVVFGIIGSKSAPLDHKGRHRSHDEEGPSSVYTAQSEANEAARNEQRKYMVLTLVDPTLRWSVDMFLFTTAYTRWRMLTPGTLIALLNPGIMPPPPSKADTGRWSLRLSSSDDTILEVGTSADLGWCKALKRNGEACGQWIDGSRHAYCEWHVELSVERAKAGRMDIQGAGFGGPGKKGGKFGKRIGAGKFGNRKDEDEDDRDVLKYSRYAQSSYFISAAGFSGRGTASLLDAEDNMMDRGGREERTRKLLAEREKERDMARQLGSVGQGAGAEYMRHRHGEATGQGSGRQLGHDELEGSRQMMDAKELGLLGGSAANVQLSPLKRKKSVLEGTARKKTRFVTAKGIREAGRESLPMGSGDTRPDDSDDLEIV